MIVLTALDGEVDQCEWDHERVEEREHEQYIHYQDMIGEPI